MRSLPRQQWLLSMHTWPTRSVTDAFNAAIRASALARLAPLRAALPAGAGLMGAGEFAAMSAHAFDRGWLTALIG